MQIYRHRISAWLILILITFLLARWVVKLLLHQEGQLDFALEQRQEYLQVLKGHCAPRDASILDILDIIKKWKISDATCKHIHQIFHNVYDVKITTSAIQIPQSFKHRVADWLGHQQEFIDGIQNQRVVSIFNKFTNEHTFTNPIRSLRPGIKDTSQDLETYVETLSLHSAKDCDFCNFKEMTATNSFGHLESEHAVTSANVFPFIGFHGLIILKRHHPLRFREEEFLDVMLLANQWFRRAHKLNPDFMFPLLTWDLLPKASASQIHPHAQVMLNKDRTFGQLEMLRDAATTYSSHYDGSYFVDLVKVHAALGLTICYGNATAIISLTPKKDNEIIVLASTPSNDFYRLIYHVLRAYMDDMKLLAWSMAVFYPTLTSSGDWSKEMMPMMARLITRGPPTNPRSDISAFELFVGSNINVDPFKLSHSLKKSLSQRGVSSSC